MEGRERCYVTIQIAPSILSADFSNLAEALRRVKNADLIHVDVMDGHFVPNITIGPLVVAALRKVTTLPLDVHLMISNPELYVDAFARAGADIITVHAETCIHLHRTVNLIKEKKIKAGVALNPATSLGTIKYLLDELDLVLLMAVNPGFGGQELIPAVLPKISELHGKIGQKKLPVSLEVDGGINPQTAGQVVEAGADILVAGSAVFGQPDPGQAVEELRKIAENRATS